MPCREKPFLARRTTAGIAVSVLLAVIPASRLCAQAQVPDAAPAVRGEVRLETLKDGLDNVYWDLEQRGPLLAIAPDGVQPDWQQQHTVRLPGQPKLPPPPPPERLDSGVFRLTDLADYFGRRIVPLSGLTVVAPARMVLLKPPTDKPDIYADFSPVEKMQMLEATLTAAQWQALGSERGLGAGDLSHEQREIYLSLLPDPFTIMTAHRTLESGLTYPAAQEPTVLTGGQRTDIRLRLSRNVRIRTVFQGSEGGLGPTIDTVQQAEVHVLPRMEGDDPTTHSRIAGSEIRSEVPAHLKPQQIDFDSAALRAPVSISGATTVGELVQRIRTATRAEIYVDGRMAKQTVFIRASESDQVRAGELLKALCWGLTGAVRHIDQAVFLLTADIEGYGTRVDQIQEWTDSASRLKTALSTIRMAAIRKMQPMQYLHFADNDPMAVSTDIQKKVEGGWDTWQGRFQGATMPLSALSAAQQKAVQETQQRFEATKRPGAALLSPDTVNVLEALRIAYVVPEIGEVQDEAFGYLIPDELRLLPPPPTQNDRPKLSDTVPPSAIASFCLAPATPEEARTVIHGAQEHGLHQIWLVVPDPASPDPAGMEAATASGKAILSAAIQEAARTQPPISVVGVARLLTLAPSNTDSATAIANPSVDTEITGLTSLEAGKQQEEITRALTPYAPDHMDLAQPHWERARNWLIPSAPSIASQIKRRATALAATTGLAGFAVTNAAAPGYCTPTILSSVFFSDAVCEVGYTLARRLAFVREHGYDPIDIASFLRLSINDVDVSVPFLSDPTPWWRQRPQKDSPQTLWNTARYTAAAKFLSDLYPDLIAALPTSAGGKPFPIYLRSLGDPEGSWFARWTKPDALPIPQRDAGGMLRNPTNSPATSETKLFVAPYSPELDRLTPETAMAFDGTPPPPAIPYAHYVSKTLFSLKAGKNSLLLDLSEIPVADALSLLHEAMPSSQAPEVKK